MRILSLFKLTLSAFLLVSCSVSAPGPGEGGATESPWKLSAGRLTAEGVPVLENVSPQIRVQAEKNTERGAFLVLRTDNTGTGLQQWPGLKIVEPVRITPYYRMKPWWTRPAFIETDRQVPRETEALLWQRRDGRIGMLLPLLDRGYRFTAQGDSAGFSLVADNNCDHGEAGVSLLGAYVALGDDPYALVEEAFAAVVGQLGTGSLRSEKPLPQWLDYLGWASWYAFFQEVDEEKFLAGIKSLSEGGIQLGFVLLDDGWESVNEQKELLTAFEPDPRKFPHGLSWLVEKATLDFHIPYFLVWQTMQGYWNGIDSLSPAMAKYKTYRADGRSNRQFNMQRYQPLLESRYNTLYPEALDDFYIDYHAFLALSGVDGVKVDNQAALEYMTYNLGPITEVTGAYIAALESSIERYFGPASAINCMSMVHDALYRYKETSVTRTSTDFFPDSAESWGPHLVLNAYNSFIWGQLIQPDWDMIKSAHPWGAFHAAARAISGGPVYLSDEPGQHDFRLIRRLALPDGRILRCPGPPRPTADILFRDPQTENVLLKIFNRNRAGTFVLAAFNCRCDKQGNITVTDTLSVNQIRGTNPDSLYCVHEFGSRVCEIRKPDESWPLSLSPGEFRLYTVSVVDKELAPLGHLGMYNGGGIFNSCGWERDNVYSASLLSGGEIGFYSERVPSRVEADRQEVSFDYNAETRLLVLSPGNVEPVEIKLFF
ncbi:MAG TPA: Sip1-related alpha-galactosidase [archaeon]|nr:Sip1-related alpha-galactosidase [archaeon]